METYATNDKARFDYEIVDTLEAGMVLFGYEVKSVKKGSCSIRGAYVKILGNEVWLLGAIVSPYQPNNIPAEYDAQRKRKLLLKKSQIKYLIGKNQEKGLTLVPIKLYNKNGLIKLEVGIGKGKKKSDKREKITNREVGRKIERALKSKI